MLAFGSEFLIDSHPLLVNDTWKVQIRQTPNSGVDQAADADFIYFPNFSSLGSLRVFEGRTATVPIFAKFGSLEPAAFGSVTDPSAGFVVPSTVDDVGGPPNSGLTIAEARTMPLGSVVTIKNVVISTTTDLTNSGFSATFNVQDATGGALVFASNADIDTALAGLSTGDQIDVTATVTSFNGLLELAQPSLATSLVTAGVGVPTPIVTTSTDYQDFNSTGESLENRLVSLSNVHFTGLLPGETFTGATNYTVTDGVNSVSVRVQTGISSLVGDLIPTGQVNLSGIFTQFDATNPLPGVSGIGYQLLPLDDSSIMPVPEPSASTLATLAAALTAVLTGCRRRSG